MRGILLVSFLGAASSLIWLRTPTGEGTPERQFQQALEAYDNGDPSLLRTARHVLEQRTAYADHARLLTAVQSLSSGNPELALNRLAALQQHGALRTEILRYSGEALYRLGRLSEAEAQFRMLAREAPSLASARRWLGAIYFDLGAYQAAIVELEALTELAPDDFRPHRLIGLMRWEFEQYSEALPHYKRVLELDPPDDIEAEVRIELARSLAALRRYNDALDVLQAAPSTPLAQVVAAQCHWNSSRQDEARQLLSAARAEDPTIREAYLLEADIRSSDADFEGALEVLRAAVATHPHDAECRYCLGLLLEQTGRIEESAREMAAWEEKQALAARLTELNEQATTDPWNADIRNELAEVCTALGKEELAEVWRRAADACRSAQQLR